MRWLLALASDYRLRLVLGGLVLFAAFAPVGVRGRYAHLESEVSRLRDENRRLRDYCSGRFEDLGRTLVAMRGYLQYLDAPAADALPHGGGEAAPSVAILSGYYCSAMGRDGVTVAPGVSWYVGDRTPYGVLSASGVGWADFGGRMYMLDDGRHHE